MRKFTQHATCDIAHHVPSNIGDEVANIVDVVLRLYRIVLTSVEEEKKHLKQINLVYLFSAYSILWFVCVKFTLIY